MKASRVVCNLTQSQVNTAKSSLMFRGQLWIDNKFQSSSDGKTFDSENPATGQIVTQVAQGSAKDIDVAVHSSRAAFEGGAWSGASPADRKQVMMRWADLIDAHRLELALLDVLEAGKPVSETFNGDIAEVATCIRYHAEAIDKIMDYVAPTDPSVHAYIRREPVGVVGAVLPWNFSAHMFAWKAGPALATGNSLLVKPAEQTSLATLRLAELAAEAGLPPGVLNVVPGFGDVGEALGRHMDVDMVAFTGSTEVGKLFLKYAGESNLKRISLECGGKSPQVVFADSARDEEFLQQVAEHCTSAAFWNMSENCSCGSRLLVEEPLREPLLRLIQAQLDTWQIGDPLNVDTMVGSLIERQHMDKVLRYIDVGKQSSARLVRGGNRVLQDTGGYFVEPTIFDGVRNQDAIAQEEIFGPVLSVISFSGEDEAVKMANDSPFGLAASLYSSDVNTAHRVANRIRAGTVSVNAFSEGDMTTPFGGYKQSGFVGRDKSIFAHDQYVEQKTIWMQMKN